MVGCFFDERQLSEELSIKSHYTSEITKDSQGKKQIHNCPSLSIKMNITENKKISK